MSMAVVPEQYERELTRLSATAWRERKQAAENLRDWVRDDRQHEELMDVLAERLLTDLLSAEGLLGRAACHEVLVAIGAPCIPNIIDRLNSPAPSQRLLIDLLGEIGDGGHVTRLCEIVQSEQAEANLRAAAVSALGRLGDQTTSEVLVGLLTDSSEMLLVHVLDALHTSGAKVAVEALHPLTVSPFTRKAAVAVLGQSGQLAAIPILLGMLADAMAGVRAAATRALAQLDAELSKQGLPDRISTELRAASPEVLACIRMLIEHRDAEVRTAAILLAGLGRDPAAVEAVLEVMDDPLMHEQALAMVASMGEVAAGVLVSVAATRGGVGREHLIRMVGALPGSLVEGPVLDLLSTGLLDPLEDAGVAAAEALERVGDRGTLGQLYQAMRTPGRLGEAAADAMAAILQRNVGTAHADLGMLAGSAWSDRGDLARNLCRVVGQLGSSRYAPHLVSMLGSAEVGVRVGAAQALGQLHGEHEGAGALCFALTDEEPLVRAAACRSLGLVRAPGAVTSLLTATSDRSPLVRAGAVAALVTLDNPAALARLRAIVAEDSVPTVVVQAIAGLGDSGLEQDLTMLMSLCTSQDWEVVKAAARALQGFKAHRATAALLGLLSHERWDVRWAAAEVLSARADPTAAPALRRALDNEEDSLVRQVIEEAIAGLELPR